MNVETETPTHETESGGDRGLHYPNLTIEGLRGIKELHIPRLGRVNLITGKNNTGKSTVLEALRLHAHNGSPNIINEILSVHEGHRRDMERRETSTERDVLIPVSALFHGHPARLEDCRPITIATSSSNGSLVLGIRVGWFTAEKGEYGVSSTVEREMEHLPAFGDELALVINAEDWSQKVALELFRRDGKVGTWPIMGLIRRCLFISPHSLDRTDTMAGLWDDVALTEDEDRVVEALRIIEPGISAVSMVGGDGYSRMKMVLARVKGMPRPVPLRSLGDGVNRLFSIALSLVNAKGGVLLIDEFENGLHYSVQADVWRMIFALASSLDVQVFATTHSEDAIRGFLVAAAESPSQAGVLKLVRRRDESISAVFEGDDLDIIAGGRIEVR